MIFLLLLFLVFSTFASAQPLPTPPEELASFSGVVSPPSLPEDTQNTPIIINLATEQGELEQSHVLITLQGATNKTTLIYLDKGSTLTLELPKGSWNITLRIDMLGTEGKDYYFTGTIDTNRYETFTAPLLPVGSARGVVRTNDGKVITDTTVTANCGPPYGDQKPTRTNTYGTFRFDWLPVGTCTFSSRSDGHVGYTTARINQGTTSELIITLTEPVAHTRSNWVFWALAGLILMVLLFYYLSSPSSKHNKSERGQEARKDDNTNTSSHAASPEQDGTSTPAKSSAPAKRLSQRTRDILHTLTPNEQRVATFLLENPGAYQNKIVHATSIPKTTLLRILTSLERKNIISIKKEGKIKRIRLTPWFLGEKQE
ncbi:hypothetical protein D6783_00205 [Candidatus Woesearchaeota archaeon]|nr:MAG: hypothetical protein D6783_00205 [Candidatus Woesearchaeota archaeon]